MLFSLLCCKHFYIDLQVYAGRKRPAKGNEKHQKKKRVEAVQGHMIVYKTNMCSTAEVGYVEKIQAEYTILIPDRGTLTTKWGPIVTASGQKRQLDILYYHLNLVYRECLH
jgi:hypothetical protein